MDYEDIRTSEDRSRLLKVLGNDPELKIMRHYDPIKMQKGDAFLVCSDGFWEHVLDQEMEETLQQSYDAEEWLNRMLKIQYGRAKNRDDNYTVICGIVEEQDATDSENPEEIMPHDADAISPANKGIIASALTSVPESPAEKLHDEVHTEPFETMPVNEVELEQEEPLDKPSGASPDTPFNVPYQSQFRKYNEDENVMFSYSSGNSSSGDDFSPDRYDEEDEAYCDDEEYEEDYDDYDEAPKKKGFFSKLFGSKR